MIFWNWMAFSAKQTWKQASKRVSEQAPTVPTLHRRVQCEEEFARKAQRNAWRWPLNGGEGWPLIRERALDGSLHRDAYPVAPRACTKKFRGGLFFALRLDSRFFFLFICLSQIVRFDPTFHAPRDASVANALGALGLCHALRLSPMTAFRANAIASIITDLSV